MMKLTGLVERLKQFVVLFNGRSEEELRNAAKEIWNWYYEGGSRFRLLSIGMNKKLGKDVGIFNLPQGITCPGRSKACGICYAKKAEALYKTARLKRYLNLVYIFANGLDNFIAKMMWEIKEGGLNKIRLHESGDFYSQAYIDAWVNIIRSSSQVKFLAYTKSYRVKDLDLSKLHELPNLTLFYSTDYDASMEEAIKRGGDHKILTAHLVLKNEEPLKEKGGYFTCIPKDLERNYCGTMCQICWNAKANGKIKGVYFLQH